VAWYKPRSRWQAYINAKGVRIGLGTFRRIEDAIAARAAAEVEYGYHPNHGRPQPVASVES
jgi:hypothetical protein